MLIDVTKERLINLTQAARLLPPGRNGKSVHISTLVRAIVHGTNGNHLEAVRVGRRWATSAESVQRWIVRQTVEASGARSPRAQGGRAERDARVERRLEELDI